MKTRFAIGVFAVGVLVVTAPAALADGSGDPTAVKNENGKYYDKNSNPSYKIQSDGTVDWFTYSGFRRYHSECHVCHGPNADGSSLAPALKGSLKTMSYSDFINIVVNGRKSSITTSQESVMPPFGDNRNVMCYLEDIFVYVRARANDAIPPSRPSKHDDKSKETASAEASCLGHPD